MFTIQKTGLMWQKMILSTNLALQFGMKARNHVQFIPQFQSRSYITGLATKRTPNTTSWKQSRLLSQKYGVCHKTFQTINKWSSTSMWQFSSLDIMNLCFWMMKSCHQDFKSIEILFTLHSSGHLIAHTWSYQICWGLRFYLF